MKDFPLSAHDAVLLGLSIFLALAIAGALLAEYLYRRLLRQFTRNAITEPNPHLPDQYNTPEIRERLLMRDVMEFPPCGHVAREHRIADLCKIRGVDYTTDYEGYEKARASVAEWME